MSEESGSDGSQKGQNKVLVTAEGDSPGATLDQNGIEGREIGAAEVENDLRNLRAAELSNVTIDPEQRVASQEVEPPNDGATAQEIVLPEEGAAVAAVQEIVITEVETQAAMSPEKRAVTLAAIMGDALAAKPNGMSSSD